ncbi:MAG: Similar to F420-dependent glucose-6-phosphate dehydrogenase, Mext_1273 family [uncultured Quadrisphaera sp.]|uniref:Similar to F420-dependent glucose-6-phosphate dehydrogenase, Mext_1273 family n=1 Tax=uncultured Quadrisphaera sp. TaxID=904978 RepID=A0A6J4QCT4_9ACTN|nr:MAG: Similar to F420-dependent glucose-6-phosphate dehydrogenase, Mext_1273 family [uncultured Quadrisphaera sp.]
MTAFGVHASHEQVHPSALLAMAQRAEEVGFTAAMCSDHFSPWSERQGHSAFAWAWLGAALQSTGLPFGVVNAPGQRYHPAIIAQACATLEEMFPGRFWVALGTGEASNEHITGGGWPRKDVRNARLLECVQIMRALFAGEEVSHDGLVTVDRARLWTKPSAPPPLIGAAVTPQTAAWVAGWADGLATTDQPGHAERDVIAAYRDAGGEGRTVVQVHLSYARTDEEALALAHDQWRTNIFAPPVCWDLHTAAEFDTVGEQVTPEAVARSVFVSSDPAQHVAHLQELVDLGFDEVYLHHVGQEQQEWLEVFGAEVLPQLDVTPRVPSGERAPEPAQQPAGVGA